MSNVLPDRDIPLAAKTLVERRAAKATKLAKRRYEQVQGEGDEVDREVWRAIIQAVEELLRTEPDEGEVRH